MIYCDVLVKVSFAKHTISVKKDSGVVEGDYNTTRLIFEFEEDVSNQRVILEMSNPKGELIFAKELSGNELVLAGVDGSGNICSIFNMEGLHPFELVLHNDTSKLTSATGYLPINKRQVNSDKGDCVEGYLPLFDELIDKVDQLLEMGGSVHTHGDKTTLVPADEVSYTHKNIQDKSGTVQGALDEAITYVTEVLSSELHSHKNSKVLDNLADSNGELTYKGNPIGGSGSPKIKVMSFPQMVSSDIYLGYNNTEIIGFIYYNNEDMSKNPLPENAIVVDVGIVLNDDTEIRKNQMCTDDYFGDTLVEIFNTPVYNPNYCYPVFRATDYSGVTFSQPIMDIVQSDGYKQLNVYYIDFKE